MPRSLASIPARKIRLRIAVAVAVLLRLTRAEGRLTGMPVPALLYPSPTLAEIGDPLTLLREMPERRSLDSAAEPQPKWLCRAPSAVSRQPSQVEAATFTRTTQMLRRNS